MSTLKSVRRHLNEAEKASTRRIGKWALMLIVVLGVIAAAAEMRLLPTCSADDVGSIVFSLG